MHLYGVSLCLCDNVRRTSAKLTIYLILFVSGFFLLPAVVRARAAFVRLHVLSSAVPTPGIKNMQMETDGGTCVRVVRSFAARHFLRTDKPSEWDEYAARRKCDMCACVSVCVCVLVRMCGCLLEHFAHMTVRIIPNVKDWVSVWRATDWRLRKVKGFGPNLLKSYARFSFGDRSCHKDSWVVVSGFEFSYVMWKLSENMRKQLIHTNKLILCI